MDQRVCEALLQVGSLSTLKTTLCRRSAGNYRSPSADRQLFRQVATRTGRSISCSERPVLTETADPVARICVPLED